MAKKAMINKQQRDPKFSSRYYNRCKICGRPHAYLRNGDLQLGRGNIHGGVAGIVRISDTGEHISDRISDLHLVTSCLDLQPLRLL